METTKAKYKIAAPWVQYVNKLTALFGDDPEIQIEYDYTNQKFNMQVSNQLKATAISKLLPSVKHFGDVTLTINITLVSTASTKADVYHDAFDGNPAFSYSKQIDGVFTNPITYVVFKPDVVQFYNDDLGDINGNCTTLYQNIAKDIFNDDGVFFCTDVKEK